SWSRRQGGGERGRRQTSCSGRKCPGQARCSHACPERRCDEVRRRSAVRRITVGSRRAGELLARAFYRAGATDTARVIGERRSDSVPALLRAACGSFVGQLTMRSSRSSSLTSLPRTETPAACTVSRSLARVADLVEPARLHRPRPRPDSPPTIAQ